MADYITIEGLEVFANHGVFKEEVSLGQKFVISAVLELDVSKAGRFDDLEQSVNYAQVCKFISEYTKNNTFKLIETVAEQLSRAILLQFERIIDCKITVKKPWAPIGLPLEFVSVTVNRGWHTAYLSIGSNMGDSKGYLDSAVNMLDQKAEIRVVKTSSYIVTKPYGNENQDDFLNAAVKIETLFNPYELLDCTSEIESKCGRIRKEHWGPRTLDIDIVLFDDLVIESDNLTIPHVDMHNRDFVLRPLCEIAPFAYHPIIRKTVLQLKEELN